MSTASKLSFLFLWRQCDWGMYKRRNEALVWELAQRDNVHKIMHVEFLSVYSLKGHVRGWLGAKNDRFKRMHGLQLRKAISLKPLLIDGGKQVYVYSILDLGTSRIPGWALCARLLQSIQRKAISRWLRHAGGQLVVVAYPPAEFIPPLLDVIDFDLLVADLVDDVVARTDDPARKSQMLQNYRAVLPRCDWLIATSPVLNDKYRELAGQEIHYLPNGVDVKEFLGTQLSGTGRHRDRQSVGYVGSLNKTMDVALFEHAVASYPDVDFVLIGWADNERAEQIDRMRALYPNLVYLGNCHFQDVPTHLSRFDVLISFKKPDLTTIGNDSMKIYEYLATGKPIVSTPVPPADRFADVIYVASDRAKFAQYLGEALAERDPRRRQQRIDLARDNSWTSRVDTILDGVSQCLHSESMELR